jgi:DNA-binding CsgD family transcriptional regulator
MESHISLDTERAPCLEKLESSYDVLHHMRRITHACGFAQFQVLRLVPFGSTRIADIAILSSWPAELMKDYDDMEIGAASPVLSRLARSSVPFQFEVDAINAGRSDGKSCQTTALFRRYGMTRGAYCPVYSPAGGAGAIGYSGTRGPLDAEEMASLQMKSIAIFDRLIELNGPPPQRTRVSDRERECLLWTAEGKTSFEICKIIGISEHTVNYYLNTAASKLDASNRVQAVAIALRTGILD